MGAWVNAAIAFLPGDGSTSYGCGVVQIPYGVYQFTTPIIKPRCTSIDGNMATVEYDGDATKPAISVFDNNVGTEIGSITNLRLFGKAGRISSAIGIMLGGIPTSQSGFCLLNGASATCQSVGQLFRNLQITHFVDGFRVGGNSYTNVWQGVTFEANVNGIHYIPTSNSGENQAFEGTIFANQESHDILIDPDAFAEINIHGGAFDYSGDDSIVGPVHLNMTDSHMENAKSGARFFNCSVGKCALSIKGGAIYLMGALTKRDAFGVFNGTNNQASFDGVEWAVAGDNKLSQFFIWNDGYVQSNLRLVNFRQAEFGPLSAASIRNVPLYSTTANPPRIISTDAASEAIQADSITPDTGDTVIASGVAVLEGIYSIDFSQKDSRASILVAVDASASDTSGYSLNILNNYALDSATGNSYGNIINPRVTLDRAGLPQLVLTLVNVVPTQGPILSVVRYGNPVTRPALLTGARVGQPVPFTSSGLMQDSRGDFILSGSLNTQGGYRIGAATGQSFVITMPNCTIAYTGGIATSHTGSGCP
jgi:hypothetical protein